MFCKVPIYKGFQSLCYNFFTLNNKKAIPLCKIRLYKCKGNQKVNNWILKQCKISILKVTRTKKKKVFFILSLLISSCLFNVASIQATFFLHFYKKLYRNFFQSFNILNCVNRTDCAICGCCNNLS